MSLLEQARKDWNQFTSTGGFEVTFSFVARTGEEIDVLGVFADTTLTEEFDTGAFANMRTVFCSVSFAQFDGSDYPLRNDKGQISLFDHKVSFTNASGTEYRYRVSQAFPDNTVGVISFQLQRQDVSE